jgi:transposase
MFKPRISTQSEYEFVSIDELVPNNHLLRLIDKYIDLSFLLEKVRLYSSDENGRPTDPTILFKMMFIGYIYGIRSERQLQREIEMNVSKSGKMLYKFRKKKIERSFADLGRAAWASLLSVTRFKKKASEQALLTAAYQNMKKSLQHN